MRIPLLAALPVLLLVTAFQDTQIRVEVEAVNVFVVVTDRQGRFVTDLTKDRFIVYEDGVPQEVTSFSKEAEQPLQLGLLVDTSASVRLKLDFEKRAAINFIRSVMRRRDQALLVDFDHGTTLVQDFTDRPSEIERAIESLRAGGGTAMWDALYFVSKDKMTGRGARKSIIILSDGEDRNSQVSFDETVRMIQTSEVIVYAIGTNRFGAASTKRGEDNLREVADLTGGAAFFPYSAEKLDDAFEQINLELRSQYTLTYRPRDLVPDGRFRRIEVRLVDGKDYRVRHRLGYRLPDF